MDFGAYMPGVDEKVNGKMLHCRMSLDSALFQVLCRREEGGDKDPVHAIEEPA